MTTNRQLSQTASSLALLWGDTTCPQQVASIVQNHLDFPFLLEQKKGELIKHSFEKQTPKSWIQALDTHDIFYTFNFGFSKLVPLTILKQRYPVVILMNSKQQQIKEEYQSLIQKSYSHLYHAQSAIEFLPYDEPDVLLKMKSFIQKGYKILIVIDGNEEVSQAQENLVEVPFKNNRMLFHKGYANLNYLLQRNQIHGLAIEVVDNKKVSFLHFNNEVDPKLVPEVYLQHVMEQIFKNLDHLIKLDNVHQWFSLQEVSEWKRA